MDDVEPRGPEDEEDAEKLRRIEDELEKLVGTVKFAGPDDGDRESALRDIEQRAKAARQKHEATPIGTRIDPETSRSMGVGLSAAYAIIGVPLFGAGLGWLADRMLGTGFCVFVGVVLGLIVGIAYAVMLSNRQ